MKIKYLSTLLFGLMASLTVGAQQLKEFTLEDLNFGGHNYHNMIPQSRYCTWWGDQLVRLEGDVCYLVNKSNGNETKLFDKSEVNQWIAPTRSIKVNSLGGAQFPYADKSVVVLRDGVNIYTVDFKKHSLVSETEIADGDNLLESNNKSGAMAILRGKNLFLRLGMKEWQLSKDGSREIVYGQSVHRDEFGIHKGTFFSNDGTKLAFYRMDQSMVVDYPQVTIPEIDYFNHPETQTCSAIAAPDKYPMTGETSHEVTVGVFDSAMGKTVYLKAGDPKDRYFTNISWSPDDKTIYMFELNRDQNDCRLVSYDAKTGEKTGELYRETDEKYVEPQHPIVFLPWDNSQFIMQSQKDGYNHLYLCTLGKHGSRMAHNTESLEIKQLTQGKWVVLDVLGFNTKRKSIIIASNEISPIQRNLFAVDVKTGKRTRVDETGDGWHNGMLSESGAFIFDKYSSPNVPNNIAIVNTENGKKFSYFRAEDPWKGYNVPEYSCGTVKAADGETDLYWRMVKPTNFDPKKKYPTIVYVYGGPHAHNVDARWHYSSRSWETYMAQNGYLLFILDNRGSENRGKAFEQATFRQLGQEEMKDQMKGVEYLKSLPYVDADRIGVHGWSFGGFMTISLMTNYPDVFKVGVAGGPVIDWHWYEVMYGERYMDTPQTNPEGYKKTSLLYKAKDLKGKLQIITGDNDATVVPQHCLTFIKACIAAGTQPDFFVYPGEPHNMRGHQSTHLHERISQYFFDYLK
ncbi:DPP IV N-terminal domain-containing protein [uncultured Prevotella sp.]|uniref:S9 family peptidase n=1 Tax=uncultured Prevotella sp. TaxID=159272 RepID=UPI0027E35CC6|nr:DPP IV N-terminal domain-containing protein [uncultured Prevotella sp.]